MIIGGQHFKSKSEYDYIHKKVRDLNGSANKCENPDCLRKSRRYEWALRKGHTYSTNKDDYIQLCASCHRKYDETLERRKKISDNHKWIIYHNRMRKISQFDMDGNKLNEYSSIYEAARKTGLIRTGISNNLSGRSSNCGGFIWKYNL